MCDRQGRSQESVRANESLGCIAEPLLSQSEGRAEEKTALRSHPPSECSFITSTPPRPSPCRERVGRELPAASSSLCGTYICPNRGLLPWQLEESHSLPWQRLSLQIRPSSQIFCPISSSTTGVFLRPFCPLSVHFCLRDLMLWWIFPPRVSICS